MDLSEERLRKYVERLLLSRMRILCTHGFYGLLLMHMRYSVDENVETACTDGVFITFGTEFLDNLSDGELDFVMMHEIMHVVLQHCLRGLDSDAERFNIACDIVVNSNILLENGMDRSKITLAKYGEAMHIAPDGKEGYEYTAEEVYGMLSVTNRKKPNKSGKKAGKGNGDWDDHSKWGTGDDEHLLSDIWTTRLKNAAEAIEIRDPSNSRGMIPLAAQRLLKQLQRPETDWRTILNDFVQEDIVDYSFTPPDRRFTGDFFLPDFNEKEDSVENVLFMIDTSGSMSDSMLTKAYSEVKGAIDQFNGRLKGWLGFFDAEVIPPKEFASEDEFMLIRPAGGGGTDFKAVFNYVSKMMDEPPASIIILTDGYAPFPSESAAKGIPVLWLINNPSVTPPWGRLARIGVD